MLFDLVPKKIRTKLFKYCCSVKVNQFLSIDSSRMSILKVTLILTLHLTYLISVQCFESIQTEQQANDRRRQSRQLYEMTDLVNDVAMITLLGIPFFGLFALGANIFGPMINESLSNSRLAKDSTSSWSSYFQLYQKMIHLENLLKKLHIFESECQLRAICEISRSKSKNNLAKSLINELKR